MQTLANWDGGPGPWILFFPLIWAAVVIGVVTVLRRTVWRGRRGPWRAMARRRPLRRLADRHARPPLRLGRDRRGRVLAPAVRPGRAVRPYAGKGGAA